MDSFLGFRSKNNMLKRVVVTVLSMVPHTMETTANHLTWDSSESVDGGEQNASDRVQAPESEKPAAPAPSADPRDDVQMRQVDPPRVPANGGEAWSGSVNYKGFETRHHTPQNQSMMTQHDPYGEDAQIREATPQAP